MTHYQNSLCGSLWLHNFVQVKQTPKGYLERCTRCKKQMHFPHNVSNAFYLSYHIRQALQPVDPRFKKEYPSFQL